MAGRIITAETRKKISDTLSGRHLSEDHKANISSGLTGHKTPESLKQKLSQLAKENYADSEYVSKRNNGIVRAIEEGKMKGFLVGHKINLHRKVSSETKRKIRIGMTNHIINHRALFPVNTGNQEKEILDRQEVLDRCKILRQYPIAGYFVDGYCSETNTVYEVYEKRHKNRVFEDLNRENEICNCLGCDFIILWER